MLGGVPQVVVNIPSMLAHCAGDRRDWSVDAPPGTRLTAFLAALRAGHPLLAPHVWDDAGAVRRHVLVFLNDTPLRWLDEPDPALRDGDRVTIVQAISGG
jgi:sulfur carrier protein ThiS